MPINTMRYFVGVDFHKSTSYLTIMDQSGQIEKQGRIENNKEELTRFLAPYPETSAVLEAGRNWTLMYDWLEELTDKVTLAHPLKVKAIASAKIKTDKIDAKTLAHLLRADLIPMAYVPTLDARTAREILRQRMFFVNLSTMVKNRIRTVLDRHPELPEAPTKNIFARKSRGWFNDLPLADREKKTLNQDLALLDDLKTRVEESDNSVVALLESNTNAQLLKTIPGIGQFFAVLISYEIDDVNRFDNAKKLAAYAGLIPSTYSSGPKTRHGHITRQGNKYLRWAFVEAVWPGIASNQELKHYYLRIKQKHGANSAKVATARRLLSIAYHVLREQREYQDRYVPACGASDQVLNA